MEERNKTLLWISTTVFGVAAIGSGTGYFNYYTYTAVAYGALIGMGVAFLLISFYCICRRLCHHHTNPGNANLQIDNGPSCTQRIIQCIFLLISTTVGAIIGLTIYSTGTGVWNAGLIGFILGIIFLMLLYSGYSNEEQSVNEYLAQEIDGVDNDQSLSNLSFTHGSDESGDRSVDNGVEHSDVHLYVCKFFPCV